MAVQTYKLPGIGPGMPDYTTQQPGSVRIGALSTLADLAELAARLGSPVTFDRRGNVLFYDSFEDGLRKWYKYPWGTGASVRPSILAARSGAVSAQMTVGNAEGNFTEMARYLTPTILGKIGVEASFVVNNSIYPIVFTLVRYTGVYYLEGQIRYYPNEKKLKYLDENNIEQDMVTSLELENSPFLFHTVKFVYDMVTEKYLRCLINELTIDMSGIKLYKVASTLVPTTFVYIFVYNTTVGDGTNPSIFVDDVILTQNEPDNLPA